MESLEINVDDEPLNFNDAPEIDVVEPQSLRNYLLREAHDYKPNDSSLGHTSKTEMVRILEEIFRMTWDSLQKDCSAYFDMC